MRMDKNHPQWQEFLERLEGPEGCNFRESGKFHKDGEPKYQWDCNGGMDKSYAHNILIAMGLTEQEVQDSYQFFDEHGGHCDCEILFNVADSE